MFCQIRVLPVESAEGVADVGGNPLTSAFGLVAEAARAPGQTDRAAQIVE